MNTACQGNVMAMAHFPTIEAFESLSFDPEIFDHAAHIYVAWSYLKEYDLLTTIERYGATLKRLTTKLGVPGKYHETITWFYLIVIAERLQLNTDVDAGWSAFVRHNRDLLEGAPTLLTQHYSADRLNSDLAKKLYVLPDRLNAKQSN